jgi:hypothetical protein
LTRNRSQPGHYVLVTARSCAKMPDGQEGILNG